MAIPKILDYPHRIIIELTPQCNLSCSMCPRNYIQTKDGYMSKDLWRRLVDDIAKTEPDTIILPFWRGESLLHPDFIELIQYALNKSLRIHISTNGNLVTEEYDGSIIGWFWLVLYPVILIILYSIIYLEVIFKLSFFNLDGS